MRKRIVILQVAMVLVALSFWFLLGDEANTDLKATIDAIGNKAEKCFLSGDIDGMMQYYCDDIISMPNFHRMIKGKTDLKRMTEAIFSSGMKFKTVESTTLEVRDSGDYVYEIGTYYHVVLMPNSTEPVKQDGKYVTIWKKLPNGEMKIAVEIYNSDENPFKKEMK